MLRRLHGTAAALRSAGYAGVNAIPADHTIFQVPAHAIPSCICDKSMCILCCSIMMACRDVQAEMCKLLNRVWIHGTPYAGLHGRGLCLLCLHHRSLWNSGGQEVKPPANTFLVPLTSNVALMNLTVACHMGKLQVLRTVFRDPEQDSALSITPPTASIPVVAIMFAGGGAGWDPLQWA